MCDEGIFIEVGNVGKGHVVVVVVVEMVAAVEVGDVGVKDVQKGRCTFGYMLN